MCSRRERSSSIPRLPCLLLQIQLEQTKHALSILLGLPPGDLTEILAGSAGIPVPPPQIAVGIPADLLRRRPDVRRAEYQAMAQAAQIGVARADLFPAFSLGGTFSLLSTNFGTSNLGGYPAVGEQKRCRRPCRPVESFQLRQVVNNVRVQDARFQELLITYQNAVLQAQQNVEDGLVAFLRVAGAGRASCQEHGRGKAVPRSRRRTVPRRDHGLHYRPHRRADSPQRAG